GAQSTTFTSGAQAPSPSHETGLASVLLHVPGPQAVPLGAYAQAPLPLQAPVWPQGWVARSSGGHPSRGSVPAMMAPQTPSVPAPWSAAVHAKQVPVHEVSQQTPSTQLLDWHQAVCWQGDPLESLSWHFPLMQMFWPTQSVSSAQGLAHAPLLQA